jgi:hypothetical protein
LKLITNLFFWIGLVWLIAASLAARFFVDFAIAGLTSDFMNRALSKEQTNQFITLINERIESAFPNVSIPVFLIVFGLILKHCRRSKIAEPGTGQPATHPVVEPEGGDNPQPEAERRSR